MGFVRQSWPWHLRLTLLLLHALLPSSFSLLPRGAVKKFEAILFHKPTGCVTTHRDNQDLPVDTEARPTVYDFLPCELRDRKKDSRFHAVGRLDLKTSGLLILTTDGRLVHHVTDPETKIEKTYVALCMGRLADEVVERLRRGVDMAGGNGFSAPARVDVEGYEGKKTRIRLTICEGKNRQIRRMLHAVQSGVMELERTHIGNLDLSGIEKPGDWRYLTEEEVVSHLGYQPALRRKASDNLHESGKNLLRKTRPWKSRRRE